MLINWKLALDIESYATTNFCLESYFSRNSPDEQRLNASSHDINHCFKYAWQTTLSAVHLFAWTGPYEINFLYEFNVLWLVFQGPWAQESACAGWGRTRPITTDLWAHTGSSSGWGGRHGQIPCKSQRLSETETHLVGQWSNRCKCKSITEVYSFEPVLLATVF